MTCSVTAASVSNEPARQRDGGPLADDIGDPAGRDRPERRVGADVGDGQICPLDDLTGLHVAGDRHDLGRCCRLPA
jgi:hypothetical protein